MVDLRIATNEVKEAFCFFIRSHEERGSDFSPQDCKRLFPLICSFWNQNMAIFIVKIVRPDGRVLMFGAFLELIR